ncbi:hypothetical protein J2Z50_006717 [Ensifer mexicanus]|nr:hypothetical protein [Sinorhizobium mexicanum]
MKILAAGAAGAVELPTVRVRWSRGLGHDASRPSGVVAAAIGREMSQMVLLSHRGSKMP